MLILIKRVLDLTEEEVAKIRAIMTAELKVEGALRSEVQQNIKRLNGYWYLQRFKT